MAGDTVAKGKNVSRSSRLTNEITEKFSQALVILGEVTVAGTNVTAEELACIPKEEEIGLVSGLESERVRRIKR